MTKKQAKGKLATKAKPKPKVKGKDVVRSKAKPKSKGVTKSKAKPKVTGKPKPKAKVAAKKPTVKKPTVKAEEKKLANRVPPRIEKRLSEGDIRPPEEYVPVDTAKAVAFGMSIVQEMKRTVARADAVRAAKAAKEAEEIRLGSRPTSRDRKKSTLRFSSADLKEFKKLLVEARVHASRNVASIRSVGFSETDDHEADGGDGTAQTLRLQALGQVGTINRTIQQIDEALHRISDGTYGVCASCGQLIRKKRLLNQPFVLTCMECQQAMESEPRT